MWLPPLGQQSTSSAEVLRAGCTGWCGPKGGAEEPTPPEVWEQAGGFWTLSFWGNAQRVSNIGCFIPGDLLRLKDCSLSGPSPAEPGRSSSCLASLKLLLPGVLKILAPLGHCFSPTLSPSKQGWLPHSLSFWNFQKETSKNNFESTLQFSCCSWEDLKFPGFYSQAQRTSDLLAVTYWNYD